MDNVKTIVARVFLDYEHPVSGPTAYDSYMHHGPSENIKPNVFLNTKEYDVVSTEMQGLYDDIARLLNNAISEA